MKRLRKIARAIRHPVEAWAWRRYLGDLSSKQVQRAAYAEIYVSRQTRWAFRDCGEAELRAAARWSGRAAAKAERSSRRGASREVRGLSQRRAAALLDSWAEIVPKGKRISDLSPRIRYRVYREVALWQSGGLS